jgi:hypothetical protein
VSTTGGPRDGNTAAPAQTSHFVRLEAQPLFVGESGQHPLPPVLPLDQTLPVAGFSEVAGDSFALVDLIYRNTTPADPNAVLALVGTAFVGFPAAPGSRPPATAEKTAPASAVVLVGVPARAATSAEVSDTAPPDSAEATGTETSSVAAAVAGVVLAAWLGRGRVAPLVRSVVRAFRGPSRYRTHVPAR